MPYYSFGSNEEYVYKNKSLFLILWLFTFKEISDSMEESSILLLSNLNRNLTYLVNVSSILQRF